VSWARNYGWLDHFWRDVVAERTGRSWVVATLYAGDLHLRDGAAFALVCEQLHGRRVRQQFVRAWSTALVPAPAPHEDVLLLGRPKPYAFAKPFRDFVTVLESPDRFPETNASVTGNKVRFDGREFRRQELESSPEERYRRCDVDYGILIIKEVKVAGGRRRLVALAGLSTLGTFGLAMILADEERREKLLGEVRRVLPWRSEFRPHEHVEVCVRISVDGEAQLADILNTRDFRFQVEAVAMAAPDGLQIGVAPEEAPQLLLIPEGNGTQGGRVRVAGAPEVWLTPARFALLSRLVESPDPPTAKALSEYIDRVAGGPNGGSEAAQRSRVAKLAHDLNARLRKDIPALAHARLVRCKGKQYRLHGVRGTIERPNTRLG